MIGRRSAALLAIAGLLPAPLAVPARAAPGLMNGDYQVRVDGSDFGIWTFTPDCEAGDDFCTARVAARPKPWTAEATLSDGRWTLTRGSPTLFSCPDGSASPGEMRAKWDPDSLSGSLVLAPDGKRCGGSEAPLRGALRLTKL